MIVTSHPPGYLPGVSVIAKVAQADAVIWLDDLRFTTPGYVNRNQLPDGTWLTVPVDRENHRSTIREVTLAGEDWQGEHIAALRSRYGDNHDPYFDAVVTGEFGLAGSPLVDLNLELIEWIIGNLGLGTREFRQSDYPAPGGDLSSKLIRMVKAVGGSAYLSTPTSRLDPAAFAAAGIELLFFRYAGRNPSVIDPLLRSGRLPTRPEQEVSLA